MQTDMTAYVVRGRLLCILLLLQLKERNIIVVHQFKNNGYDIVLDVNSGAIHVGMMLHMM